MPSATDNYRKVGDMWERGMALLAWKLDGRGGYDRRRRSRSQGHRQRSSRLPDNKRGGRNNKYKAIIAIKSITRKMNCNRCSNVGTMHVARSENSSGDEYWLRVITGQGVRRGGSCRRCRGHPTHVWVVYPG